MLRWHHRDDIVRWRIKSPGIREVQVWAEWACDLSSAGGAFHIEGGQPVLNGTVESTGGWDHYQFGNIGVMTIRAGESDIVMRPVGDLPSAMVDLRALHFVSPGGVPLATGMVRKSKGTTKPDGTHPQTPVAVAAFLLDDDNSDEDRKELINAHLDAAGDIIPLMAAGLPEDAGSKEEYRRIPWIWRVAIAVGKHGDADQIRSVLAASLPQNEKRLEHWQAVVIGGGLINGIGLSGKWPLEELTAIMANDSNLKSAWQRTLEQSAVMADDDSVPPGTRYDALRMVAMLNWAIAEPRLTRYLQKGVHDELQMGAISGISDVRNDAVVQHLINGYENFSESNGNLALDALLRTDARTHALLKALSDKKLPPALQKDKRIQALQRADA